MSGFNSTFASQPDPSGPHYQEIPSGHKKNDEDVFETGRAGGMDDDMKTKAARVGSLGGGQQRREGYAGVDAYGRDTTHPITVDHPVRNRGDVEQHKNRDDSGHPRLGLRGGIAPGDIEDSGSRKYAPSTTTHESGTIGSKEVKQRETPDWSKIPKDHEVTTDVGSDDDPGRFAQQQFAKMTTRQYKGTNRQDRPSEPQNLDRSQDVVMEEGITTMKNTLAARENAFEGLNSDENI